MKCLKPRELTLALFSLEGIERCMHFANVYTKSEGMICFPCLRWIAKIFCYTKASACCGKRRIVVCNEKKRSQRVSHTVTISLGMPLLIREKHLGIRETSQFLQIHAWVLWWEPFVPLAVKQGVGILVEDPWQGTFPPAERGDGVCHSPIQSVCFP